jgi:hypothetical protein
VAPGWTALRQRPGVDQSRQASAASFSKRNGAQLALDPAHSQKCQDHEMSGWHRTNHDEVPRIVREAWRKQLHDELAEKSAKQHHDAALRFAVLLGMLMGVFGCVLLFGS